MDWSIVLQIVIGALISAGFSVVFVVWMENQRNPKLCLEIGGTENVTWKPGHPANRARWLRLKAKNKQLPWLARRWLSRNTALHCSGLITFYHLDGQNVFERPMQARWWGPREPLPILARCEGLPPIKIIDPVRLASEMHRDIYSGESEQLDLAVRFDDDEECYGWCDENYLSKPQWRNPDWKLGRGKYLVEATLVSSGERCNVLFRLINDVPVNEFRLEKAQPSDYKIISHSLNKRDYVVGVQ